MNNSVKRFRAGWLVDGSGGAVREQQLLTVEGGRISRIEPWSEGLGIADEELVDLSPCTLLPPLTDAHCHLFLSATTDLEVRRRQLAARWEQQLPAMEQHAGDALKHGIFALRDGGDPAGLALRMAREQCPPHQLLRTCGRGWHRRGRYGRLFGRTPEEYDLPLAEAFAAAEAKGEDAGAEFVKIFQSGLNSLTEFGEQSRPQFSAAELQALLRQAQAAGRRVMVHANGEEPVRLALQAGCHSLEHGFFMGEENLKRLRDSATVWVPTLFSVRALRQNLALLGNHARKNVLDRLLEHQLEQLMRARELGVRVAIGSDAGGLGVLHGEGVMEEMKLFRRAGFSLSRTIHCSSAVGGELLDAPGRCGLTAGAAATFLVARGTPSQLPRKLVYLEAVYADGYQIA